MTTRLDAQVWICTAQYDIVAFGGKDAKTPAPPDYTPIAQADAKAAEAQTQLGQQQLDWAKSQFNNVWPYAQQYLTSQIGATNAEQDTAKNQQDFYDSTYKPIEQQFAGQAQDYANPANTETRAGMAEADVATSFNQNRAAATSQLESYGIDPSQTRFQALDAGTRISQAAATAAAGNQSRLNTQATGLSLENTAINTGRGYPSSVAQAFNTATNSGSSGISEANSTTQTGSNAMGTPGSYFSGATSNRAGAVGALGTGFSNAATSAQIGNQIAANNTAGIGQLIGGGLGAAAMFL